jgi:hypothetical protein
VSESSTEVLDDAADGDDFGYDFDVDDDDRTEVVEITVEPINAAAGAIARPR